MTGATPNVKPLAARSNVVTPHRARWHQRVLARIVWLLVHVVSATVRFRTLDRGQALKAGRTNYIFATWHNRLALSLPLYRRFVRPTRPQSRLVAMVSASRDGGLLARILESFGVEPVRGSSSRRGPQALREMVSRGERGCDLAITPDGPRGPCYEVQDGVISTAQLSGLPIIAVSYRLQWKIRVNSWDRFQIPLPFTRCEVVFSEPIAVPRDLNDAERERLRKLLETTMREMAGDA